MSRRWCTTTIHGNRRDHDTLLDAQCRAGDLAETDLSADRMTIWFNDGDGTGWHSHDVVDLRALAGAR